MISEESDGHEFIAVVISKTERLNKVLLISIKITLKFFDGFMISRTDNLHPQISSYTRPLFSPRLNYDARSTGQADAWRWKRRMKDVKITHLDLVSVKTSSSRLFVVNCRTMHATEATDNDLRYAVKVSHTCCNYIRRNATADELILRKGLGKRMSIVQLRDLRTVQDLNLDLLI
jgi:hypothetical protein